MLKTFVLVSALSVLSAKSCNSQSIANGIDKIFRSYIDSGFSGIAIVVKNDKVVLEKGYGYANEEKKILNTPKHLFNVASIGKQFTAVTVLKLEEQGLMNTKDFIWKYTGHLGGLRDSATIDHLLMHTSGLFVEGTQLDYSSRDKYIQSVRNTPLESKPGEKYRYSNAGYVLLAAIVEIVTKEPFENVVHRMVLRPAGMKYTGFPWEAQVRKNLLATGYNNKGEPQPPQPNVWGTRGPGHLVTNTKDMLKWYKAWMGDKVISQQIKQRMLSDPIPGKETYTWNKVKTATGKGLLSKGGGRPDFESNIMWWPDDKVFVFFSINRDKNIRRLIYRDLVAYMNTVKN